MAVDFSRYLPPGVYTNPTPGPQLAVNSTLPTAVALFGCGVGFRTYVESILINPNTNDTTPAVNQNLSKQGIKTSTIAVSDPNSGQPYVLGADYTVLCTQGTTGTSDALYTIQIVIDGHIDPGDYIQVSYNYTDPTYFTPYTFYDYDDVRAAYGEPFVTSGPNAGQIQSELTLGAKFAFLNGAYQVVCVAVNPANPAAPTVGEYGVALDQLKDDALVAVIVPCTGQQPVFQQVAQHVQYESNNRYERRAILGLDGTINAVPSSQRIIDAEEIVGYVSDDEMAKRLMLVSPATFTYYSPELNNTVTLGGQFMAASLAGITVSQSFAMPLTRKVITGWTGVGEVEPDGQKNLESQSGLCVVEFTRRMLMQVRHGVSVDNIDMIHREWSITGQQDALVYRLRDYLENANLIGQPIYSFTLINVKSSAEAALQSLIRDGLLVGYMGLKARQLLTNPDVIEVSFSWLPAFPLNYIVVTFNISLTSGNITTNAGSTASEVNSSNQLTTTIGTPTSSSVNDFGGPSNTLMST
jgi:hypothetical protein